MWINRFADDASPARGEIGVVPEEPRAEDRRPLRQRPETRAAYDVQEEDPAQTATVKQEVNDALTILLPWMTSLFFHLLIVVLALVIAWSLIPALKGDEKVIVPSARLAEDAGGKLSQTQDVQVESAQSERVVEAESIATDQALNNLNTNLDSDLKLLGVSGGGGANLAAFGNTGGGEAGLKAEFFGAGGNARLILFVVDASGSLIDTLPFVIKELKESIGGLTDEQKFTVIFFQDGDPIEAPPIGWKTATAENKRKAFEYISLDAGNVVPRGKTDPVKAIRLAMRYKPELMFILSDNITGRGEFEVDRAELLKFLNDVNKDRKTAINTIQFLYPDPLGTLEAIANDHGGVYKFITEEDLGLK